jgi:hypothetical protein
MLVGFGVLVLLAPWQRHPDGEGAAADTTGKPADGTSPGGAGDWGYVQFIAEDFPSLIPATPDGQGWNGATCAPTAFAEDTHADVGVTCQYASGLTAEVAHYPNFTARDARRSELAQIDAADSPQPWRSDASTLAGVRLLSEDNPNFVWQWIEFNQQDKSLYVVVLEWAGHTQAELDEEWFSRAPFAGPAGN